MLDACGAVPFIIEYSVGFTTPKRITIAAAKAKRIAETEGTSKKALWIHLEPGHFSACLPPPTDVTSEHLAEAEAEAKVKVK